MTAENGQNIFDLSLQEFGSIEYVFEILQNNKDITINSNLYSGQEITAVNFNKGDKLIKDFIKQNKIKVNNKFYDTDTEIEQELSIQWSVYVDLTEAININKIIQV